MSGHENVKIAAVCEESFEEIVEVVEVVEEEQIPSSSAVSTAQNVKCDVMDPFFYTQVNLEAVNKDHSICHHCGEDLTNRRFYNHLFDYHGYSKQQLEIMKAQKRLETCRKRKAVDKLDLLECECGQQFVTSNGLRSHKMKIHDIAPTEDEKHFTSDNIVCPSYGCELNFSTYMDLAIHVDSFHRNLVTVSDAFRIRRMMFDNKMSFLKWKRMMEKQTNSEFFLRTTQKVSFANKTMLFKCLYSNSRGQPKGRRCEQCPSFIRCCERNSGKFEIVACFGHLGHEHETETAEARDLREMKWREIEEKVQSIYQPQAYDVPKNPETEVVVTQEIWDKNDGQPQEEHVYIEGDAEYVE
ncbi:unnamed protein product [Caenorhabditis angaria]|uniref:C2H2-type domain-containing protein n=1 Tax=Caenorhabditis angaria TaxID=860376 RepID=A0A9P1IN52_9PELO|nr:unnamed protein product [Caenorhabditis angaria]